MSNFKMGNSKFSRFVNGKGFYIALALCLVAIGTAAYVAVNNGANLYKTLTSSGATTSSTPSKSVATSSIPNWDASNPTKQTNDTVSGVKNDKPGKTGPAASSKPAEQKPHVTSKPEKQTGSVSTQTKSNETSSAAKLVFAYPVGNGDVINAYSGDKPVYDKTMADWRVHDAVDIEAPTGTPVKACASGTVCEVKMDDMYGEEIVIDHGDGLKSIYANLSGKVNVKTGQKVEVGDTIGAVGETAQAETAETAHLHFAMTKDGQAIDPLGTMAGNNGGDN
jgi:Membrane proteins related to metalloendopeptidases